MGLTGFEICGLFYEQAVILLETKTWTDESHKACYNHISPKDVQLIIIFFLT